MCAFFWSSGGYLLFNCVLYVPAVFHDVCRRFTQISGEQVKESPFIMLIPVFALALLAVIGGYIQTPWFGTFLGEWLVEGNEALLGAKPS